MCSWAGTPEGQGAVPSPRYLVGMAPPMATTPRTSSGRCVATYIASAAPDEKPTATKGPSTTLERSRAVASLVAPSARARSSAGS